MKPLASKEAERFMRRALKEAARGLGRTAPNPAVGALVVKAGKVVGRGYHRRAGAPHAEVEALAQAGARARGADLYTTLEPCNHHGKTPPCSDAILQAGIARVVFASVDPNPLVNGQGLRKLKRAGVAVVGPVLQTEADALNRPFFKFMKEGRPWVTLKAAVTLDGKLATSTGDSRWISGEASRQWVHTLRNQVDALVVGRGCVEKDNPRLTTRLPQGGRNAVRVVLDSQLRLRRNLKVFEVVKSARTVVATVLPEDSKRARALLKAGVEVWSLPGKNERVSLRALLERLGKEGLLHVMVEGGAEVFSSLFTEGLWDELKLFVAPKLVGASGVSWVAGLGIAEMAKALEMKLTAAEPVGSDILLHLER